jgi:hypothetical protein
MNDDAKQAYLDQSAAQLREWTAKIELTKAHIAAGAAGLRLDYQLQIENWQKKEIAFKEKLEELRQSGAAGFDTMKSGVQNVWNEINKLIESLEVKL